jgi:PAS domain S-box-containing protein
MGITQVSDEIEKVARHQTVPEDLQTSEIRYRRLFESARDGILILDAATRRITDVNPFMVELMGYSRDEFLGKELWEIGLFRDKDESQIAFRELQAKGYIRYEDLPLQTKAGKQWNVEFISNVYREDGRQVIQCNIRDITERRNAEERLKQSEQWLRTIFEASHEGILVEDNERIHYVNKAYLQMFGYDDPEELIGQHISVVVSPEDAGRLLEYGRSRSRGEQAPSEYEFKGKRKDGSLIDVGASVSVSNVADNTYITTMVRDITERKRTEAALRDAQERLLQALNAAGMFSWEAHPKTLEFSFSSNVERTMGFTFPKEVINDPIGSHLHPEDAERAVRKTLRAIETGEPYEDTMRMINPHTGEIVWMHSQGILAKNAEGDARFVGIAQNITERKHTEILLDTQKQALEMVVGGSPLAEVLKYLAGIVESQSSGSSAASILLLDEQGRLHNGASPSLSEDYVQAIEGLRADKSVGTCSAAAATGDTIVTPDIAADPKWQDLKQFPLGLGLQAAWSLPIVAADNRVLGTFGTYFREKREPTKFERQTVEILAKTAALAIERKRAEEALRDAHERITNIFESTTDCFYALDAHWRFTYVNPQAEEYFDRPKETMLGRVYTEAFPLTRDSEVLARLQEAMSEQKPLQFETISPTTGKWIDLHVFPADGGLGVYFRDITERRSTEEALRESEMRFRAMFEQASVGIVQASFGGTLLRVNPGFCKIVGYSEEEATGMAIRALTHPDDYEKEDALTRQLMAGEIPGYSIEKRYRRKDGRLIWGQMTATRVSHSSGEAFYVLAIVEDISERKRAEEELVKLNEQLEQRVAERTAELVGLNASLQAEIVERQRAERERASILRRLVMAQEEERRRIARDMHDQLGQQLTLLLLKLGMLKEDCGGQERLREQVETLEEVAGRLDEDVDFLVWKLRPSVLDDLGLQEAITNFAQNWSKHFRIPVEVMTHGAGEGSSTSEIDTVLYRIAQEALNNVAKHASAASAAVLLERRGGLISLIVEDDGVGFDAENTSGANPEGLGLVGMRERAALVGGTAEVESHSGEGTRVIVRVPAPTAGAEWGGHE